MPASLDPFRYVSKASAPIQDLARRVWAITRPSAASIWIGRGWDTASSGSTEHHSGRALDIMVSAKVGRMPTITEAAAGEQMVAWLIRHADRMHTRHVIWNRRIWKRRYRGTATAWSSLTGRSGISDWHEDHIHVYLDDTAGSIPDAPLVPDGTIPARPTPTPTPQEDDMPLTQQELNDIANLSAERTKKALLEAWLGQTGPTLGAAVQMAAAGSNTTAQLAGRVAGLEAAVEQLARGGGIDPAAITRAVRDGLAGAQVTVELGGGQ